jgi:hypothetical protein
MARRFWSIGILGMTLILLAACASSTLLVISTPTQPARQAITPFPFTTSTIFSTITSIPSLTLMPTSPHHTYPVESLGDIPKVILADPDPRQMIIQLCTEKFQSGTPVYMKFLNTGKGSYIVPFSNDGQLCAQAEVYIIDGVGQVGMYGTLRGTKYPAGGADDAKALIEMKTGKIVIGTPELACENDQPCPFWIVTTVDGNEYYATFVWGKSEENEPDQLFSCAWKAHGDFRELLDESKP